jgi:serine/threonine protein kinase
MLGEHPNIVKLREVIEPTKDSANFSNLFYVFNWMPSDLLQLMQLNITLQEQHIKQIIY